MKLIIFYLFIYLFNVIISIYHIIYPSNRHHSLLSTFINSYTFVIIVINMFYHNRVKYKYIYHIIFF